MPLTPEDIAVFCEPESSRYPGILKPFKSGQWAYATDGRVAVRIPWAADLEPVGKTPDIDSMFIGFDAVGCNARWPAWKNIPYDETGESGDWLAELPIQRVAGKRIKGLCWLKVASLGREVRFNPTSNANGTIQFVCGGLQGIVCTLLDPKTGG